MTKFSACGGLNILFYRGKWPAAGEKNWHFGVPTQDFTRGNSPPQAENFGILSPILRGKSGQNRQPRKPPNLADPENPP